MERSTNSTVRRSESRLRTDLSAQLITLSGAPRVSLCDLSCRGARIHSPVALAPGAQGVLSWLRFETFGTIVWASGPHAGMAFDEPLSEDAVLCTREIIDQGAALNTGQESYIAARDWYMSLRK